MRNIYICLLGLGAIAVSTQSYAAEIAKVNSRVITDTDLKDALGNFNEGQKTQLLKDAVTRTEVLNTMIDQELLFQEGLKAKLDQSEEYKKDAAQFRRQWLARKITEQNIDSQVTDQAARDYYSKHVFQYATDQYHVLHIVASDLKSAQDLRKKAETPNADFQAIAEKESKDATAKSNRGDLGFIGWDSPLDLEFKKAVINSPTGKITGPVKTRYGYHVIQVVEKIPGKKLLYDEVELQVKSDLKKSLRQAFLDKLKTQSKISVR